MTEMPPPQGSAPDEWRAPGDWPAPTSPGYRGGWDSRSPGQPQYGWAAPRVWPSDVPVGGWGPPVGEPAGVPWVVALQGSERGWVPAAHWLPLLSTWFGPLAVLLTAGERNARIREHATESLNFELTFSLAMLASALLAFAGIGFVPLAILPVAWLVLRIGAARRSARGERVRYPLTLRLVR